MLTGILVRYLQLGEDSQGAGPNLLRPPSVRPVLICCDHPVSGRS